MTTTVATLTPLRTESVRPAIVANAAPDTMEKFVRASADMSLTALLANVMVADRTQLTGKPMPGADAALLGLANTTADDDTAVDTGGGRVTFTLADPLATTTGRHESV